MIQTHDDDTQHCKARIAPHGNNVREQDDSKTDSNMFSPVGVRILLSLCVLFNSSLLKIGVKSAFLQPKAALRDLCFLKPLEYKNREFYLEFCISYYYPRLLDF